MESKIYVDYLADEEAPTLNCSDATSTTDSGQNSSSTVALNTTASDNVDRNPQVTCSHTSNNTFFVGDTTVNCSSTDKAGNTETCMFVVTVTGKWLSNYVSYPLSYSLQV